MTSVTEIQNFWLPKAIATGILLLLTQMGSSLKAQYDTQGFVIVPDLIALEDRTALEDACKRVVSRTRSGCWPHRRTVGKQFPPYGDDDPDSWGVQHVMHPDLGEPIFAKWYTSDQLIEVVKQLLDCGEDDLQMGVWVSF